MARMRSSKVFRTCSSRSLGPPGAVLSSSSHFVRFADVVSLADWSDSGRQAAKPLSSDVGLRESVWISPAIRRMQWPSARILMTVGVGVEVPHGVAVVDEKVESDGKVVCAGVSDVVAGDASVIAEGVEAVEDGVEDWGKETPLQGTDEDRETVYPVSVRM